MTVQISTLRVVPELDASKYAAGAAQKQAADRSMAETSRQVEGAVSAMERAVAVTTMRIGAASDGFERFKRQNVTGYAASMDFEGGLRKVASGLEKGRLSAEEAANAVENLSRKYQRTADPLSALAQGNASLATAIRTANVSMAEQSNAVDALMLSYQRMAQEARAAQAAEREQQRFNSTLGVGRPAVGSASSSASVFESELARVEQMAKLRAEQAGGNFSADLNQRLGVNGFGTSARSSASVFEESSRETEIYARKAAELRSVLDPVAAMQARLNAELAEYATLAARGAITADELAQAQALARAKASGPSNDNRHVATNAMFQYQDIVMTAAGGMRPEMIGLQQGSQLAGAYAGMGLKEAASTTVSALSGLVSPVSIAAIGLTTLTAAAIQWGISLIGSATKSTDALSKHEEAIKRVKGIYDAAAASGEQFGQRTQQAISYGLGRDQRDLEKGLEQSLRTFRARATPAVDMSQYLYPGADVAGITQQMGADKFGMFAGTIDAFMEDIRRGRGDVLDFNAQIQKIAETNAAVKGTADLADEILKMTEQATKSAEALKEVNKQRREMEVMYSRTAAASNATRYQSENEFSLRRLQERQRIDLSGIGARTPRQLADVARARVAAEPVDPSESPEVRQYRINAAGALEQARAEFQLKEAREERSRGLQRSIADQQMEVSLIGRSSIEAEALRREYQLIADLKNVSRRQGLLVAPGEVEAIKAASVEMRRLNEELARGQLNDSLRTERSDMLLSGADQQIAGRLRGAGLPVELQSSEADYIRRTARMQETKSAITGFFTDFRQELISNGGKVGKALGETLLNSVANVFSKASDAAFERLANLAVNALFGGAGATGGGSAVGAGTDILGRLAKSGGISNDNLAPVIPVTRAGLPDVSATSDVASYIAKAAAQRGIDPDTALRVAQAEGGLSSWNQQSNYMKNGVREPSFGPLQLYTGGGLGNEFMSKTGLDPRLSSSGPAGVDFALDHASKNGWGSWYGAAKVGVGKWDGIGGGTNGAADAVNQLAASAKAAQKGLDGFGGGIGKIGQALSTSYFPPAPAGGAGGGGGGLFSWIGGLFGSSKGPDLSKYIGLTGLFADGTESAPGGMALVGERGRELVNLPRGAQVVPNHKTEGMISAANNNRGSNGRSPGGVLQVVIQGASGDDHVRKLVEQGVAAGLQAQQIEADRGGFASTQQNYLRRKG